MKTKQLIAVISVFCLVGNPFLLSLFFLPNIAIYGIKGFLLLLLFRESSRYEVSRCVQVGMITILIWSVFCGLLNTDYLNQIIALLIDCLFFLFILQIIRHRVGFKDVFDRFLLKFVIVLSFLLIISKILFICLPDIWKSIFIGDYYHYHIPILGFIANFKSRPIWYFIEPSYCGFYMGLFFLYFCNYRFDSPSKKRRCLLLILIALLMVQSVGSYVSLAFSIGFLLYNKIFPRQKVLPIIVLYSIILLLFWTFSTIDIYKYVDIDSANFSFDDRVNRVSMLEDIIPKMSFIDKIIGLGPEYVTNKYDTGISDAYNKMICECGFLFLVWFLLFVYKLTHKSLAIHAYLLISFMFVIVHTTPLSFLCYSLIGCINRPENNPNNKICNYVRAGN